MNSVEVEIEVDNTITNKELALKILTEKTAFALEGGGVLGIGHAGALFRLAELGGLKTRTHVVGTSVGSIVAVALSCGGSTEYIRDKMFSLNFKDFKDGGNIISKIFRFIIKFGWHRGREIDRFMEKSLIELTGDPTMTFEQLHDMYGTHLTIPYLSIRHKKTKYLDHVRSPVMHVMKGPRWSSAIPYFYKPVRYYRKKELIDMIVDGGVTDNYPIHVLREQGCKPVHILGFKLCGEDDFNHYNSIKDNSDIKETNEDPPRNIKNYSLTLVDIVRQQALRYHVHKEDWKLTCKINIGNFSSTDFDLTEEDKMWLFNEGIKGMDNYLVEIEEMLDAGIYPL